MKFIYIKHITKTFFFKKSLLIGCGFALVIGFTAFLFLDAYHGSHFRSMQSGISSTEEVDLTGLRDIRASGSTSVRFSDLKRRLSHINGSKIIVDGMSEFHGYINGIPTTFFAYQRQKIKLKHLIRRWIFTGTTEICPHLVISEMKEATQHGFEYKKINIGSRYVSTDEDIDEIVDFFDNLSKDTWVHFHCAHGKGRTSVLLVMLDILKNAPKVALKDIIKRQYLLGSEDLFNTVAWKNGTYTKEQLEQRKKFIEEFYKFVCQRKAGEIQRWSDWSCQEKEKLGKVTPLSVQGFSFLPLSPKSFK